ncbi:hypothetical protein PFISCL1PPCAC_23560, partial [Pristionchus fissidentatus]
VVTMRVVGLIAAFIACATAEKIFLSSYWSAEDTKRISESFQSVLSSKDDLASLHYATSGLRLLGQKVDDAKAKRVCGLAQKVNEKDVDALFHAASIAGDLPSCTLTAPSAKSTIEAVAKEADVSSEKLFDALTAADRLAVKVDQALFDKALSAAVAKDASPKSLANAVSAASLLDKATGAKYFPKIASLVEQADEFDGKYLQLDGGLSVTSTAVYGIFQLAHQQGKAPTITRDQVLQFANHLLSRRQVFADRAAYNVIRAIGVLINNGYFVPASVSLESSVDLAKPVRLHVSNLFGAALPGAVTVRVEKLTMGDKVVDSAKTATKVAGDSTNTLFEVSGLAAKEAGNYVLHVAVEAADKKVIGTSPISFPVKATREATVEALEIVVADKDGKIQKKQSVAVFTKAASGLEVEATSTLSVYFNVKSKDGAALKPHQAFVIFEHIESGEEVVFIADAQKIEGAYKMDVNLAKEGKDFGGHSGAYRVRLVIGDALIRTPLNWIIADAKLTVPAAPVEIVRKSEKVDYSVLPEITHMFRQPEKRPPGILSDAFTFLSLMPILVLAALWARIGVNLSNMPTSIYVPIFHLGLAALFFLYFVFWLQLNMFETLKYIAVIGGVVFISGHRLLRTMADKRK